MAFGVTKYPLKLKWNASTTPSVTYHIWFSPNATRPKTYLYQTGKKTITLTLPPGTYYYWVSAYNASGESRLCGPIRAIIP
jgi:hypothetical protein